MKKFHLDWVRNEQDLFLLVVPLKHQLIVALNSLYFYLKCQILDYISTVFIIIFIIIIVIIIIIIIEELIQNKRDGVQKETVR